MGEVDSRRQIIQSVFKTYDESQCGELTPEQLQRLHLRMGGVSMPQVSEFCKKKRSVLSNLSTNISTPGEQTCIFSCSYWMLKFLIRI